MIEASNVSYSFQKLSPKLLSNVSLRCNTGELWAVMGPSGSGKTTLLDLLADRRLYGVWSGSVTMCGSKRPAWFHRLSAYVQQDDLHIPNLTVEETIMYAAWTRLPDCMTWEDKLLRVQTVLEILKLKGVRNNIVGSATMKGISGGQKKRLSIAVEIIRYPCVMFLDEPTSGLDSSTSLEVIAAVRKITDDTRLCIATIHQPSPQVFAYFDHVLLLHNGLVVFSGLSTDIVSYFENLGYNYKSGQNAAEYVLDICSKARTTTDMEILVSARQSTTIDLPIAPVYNTTSVALCPETSSWLTQLHMLTTRGLVMYMRDTASLKTEIFKNIFFGFLTGVTFYQDAKISNASFLMGQTDADDAIVDIPTEALSNFTSIFFFVFIFLWYGNTQSIPQLCTMNQLCTREVNAGAYDIMPYWASNLIAKLPVLLLLHTIYVGIFYPLCGFPQEAGYFFFLYFTLYLGGTMSFYTSQAFAALTGNAALAYAIVPPLFMFMGSFSGYPTTLPNIPVWWSSWAPYMSFMRWTYEALITNAFHSLGEAGQSVITFYDFSNFAQDNIFWILLLNIFGMAMVTLYGLQPAKSKLVKDNSSSRDDNPACSQDIEMAFAQGDENDGDEEQGGQTANPMINTETGKSLTNSIEPVRSTSLSRKRPVSQRVLEADILASRLHNTLDVDDFMRSSMHLERAQGIRVEMTDLSYRVDHIKDGCELQVVDDISAVIPAGCLCAVMGSSGAGKSTLLDLIAGRKNVGVISGSLLFDGQERSPQLARSTSYVLQNDLHLPMFTVRETLMFSARLRIPTSHSPTFLHDRVNKVMEMLALTPQADVLVGNQFIRGISNGQKRRMSIGVEIINFPGLVFLDEPTTGLDSATANEVVAALRNMSNQNRTVICTIHQCSAVAYSLFDMLILMDKGRLIYFGPAKLALEYFTDSPFQFKSTGFINPADFVIAVCSSTMLDSSTGNTISSEELAEYYLTTVGNALESMRESEAVFRETNLAAMAATRLNSLGMSKYPTSLTNQLLVMLQRYSQKTLRTQRPLVISFVRCVMMSTMFGTLYFNAPTGTDFVCYKSRYSFCFFCMFFNVIVQMQTISVYFEDRAIFFREREAKIYSPLVYWLSVWIVYIIFLLCHTFVFEVIAYSLAGFMGSGAHAVVFFITIFLSSLTGYFMCQAIAAMAPDVQTAMGLFPVAVFYNLLYSGYFQYIPNMQPWLGAWAPDISFVRWGYQALVLNEFNDNAQLPNAQFYLEEIGFNAVTNAGECILFIILIALFYFGILSLSLTYVTYEKT